MILINKKPGITPLAAIQSLRAQYPSYTTKKLAYAGRLNPLAEGLLLILEGNETKQREHYERMNKTYSFSILFGVATDTYDILGKVTTSTDTSQTVFSLENELPILFNSLIGTMTQPYPLYSAARVNGKPLYYWVRKGLTDTISIPEKKITLYDLSFEKLQEVPLSWIQKEIVRRVHEVHGDFRQEEILACWQAYFDTTPVSTVPLATCRVSCSSGTYVRSLANLIGQNLHIPSLAWTIKRETIGEYSLTDAVTLL